LRKVLGAVDRRIETPERLSGRALRHKLDTIEQPVPWQHKLRELLFPRRPDLRSWLTYAVAFVLVVGLFYGLGFHRPPGDLAGVGGIELEQPGSTSRQNPSSASPGTNEVQPPASVLPPVENNAPTVDTPAQPGTGIEPVVGDLPPVPFDGPAVGGAGLGTVLGELDDFVLVFRPNDSADPNHRSEAPNVLLLLDSDGQEIVSQIDLPYMTDIAAFHSNDSILAVVGTAGDSTYVYSVDYTDTENPVSLMLFSQPGVLTAENFFDGFLYVASHTAQNRDDTENLIVLENSTEQGTSILTLVNLAEGTLTQTGIVGAGGEVQLYRTEARVFYMADAEQYGELPEQWMARLDIVTLTLQMVFAGIEPVQ